MTDTQGATTIILATLALISTIAAGIFAFLRRARNCRSFCCTVNLRSPPESPAIGPVPQRHRLRSRSEPLPIIRDLIDRLPRHYEERTSSFV